MGPNERFSGAGHARHICKDCQRLGAEELAYRQAVRSIDRMIVWETGLKRKQRARRGTSLALAPDRRYPTTVPAKHSPIAAPLSDDELDVLADLLDEHAAFDLDGLLGILHAVAVAPPWARR
ncbi:hypothetical protein BH11MYX4_BH11MYX4_05380 [soil metagenome]